MSRECQVTGKKPLVGNNVSHSNRHTKRRFEVNLRNKRFWLEDEKRWITIRDQRARHAPHRQARASRRSSPSFALAARSSETRSRRRRGSPAACHPRPPRASTRRRRSSSETLEIGRAGASLRGVAADARSDVRRAVRDPHDGRGAPRRRARVARRARRRAPDRSRAPGRCSSRSRSATATRLACRSRRAGRARRRARRRDRRGPLALAIDASEWAVVDRDRRDARRRHRDRRLVQRHAARRRATSCRAPGRSRRLRRADRRATGAVAWLVRVGGRRRRCRRRASPPPADRVAIAGTFAAGADAARPAARTRSTTHSPLADVVRRRARRRDRRAQVGPHVRRPGRRSRSPASRSTRSGRVGGRRDRARASSTSAARDLFVARHRRRARRVVRARRRARRGRARRRRRLRRPARDHARSATASSSAVSSPARCKLGDRALDRGRRRRRVPRRLDATGRIVAQPGRWRATAARRSWRSSPLPGGFVAGHRAHRRRLGRRRSPSPRPPIR